MIAPSAVSMNTGAMASWIAWAICGTCASKATRQSNAWRTCDLRAVRLYRTGLLLFRLRLRLLLLLLVGGLSMLLFLAGYWLFDRLRDSFAEAV